MPIATTNYFQWLESCMHLPELIVAERCNCRLFKIEYENTDTESTGRESHVGTLENVPLTTGNCSLEFSLTRHTPNMSTVLTGTGVSRSKSSHTEPEVPLKGIVFLMINSSDTLFTLLPVRLYTAILASVGLLARLSEF